jgi:hypothetical protein
MRPPPPIPKTVYLPCGPVTVVRKKGLTAKRSAAGTYNWGKRRITLDAEMELIPSWLTLEHEIVHAILMDAGYLPNKYTENVCDAIAAARVAEMQAPKSRTGR